MIKVLNARLTSPFTLEIDFSDHTHGVFDANAYLASRSGPLLDKLREPAYFRRFFILFSSVGLNQTAKNVDCMRVAT
ncbi:DUF2442 domain-containing protein [Rhodoferax sp.]|uniref:DUF2442 domain-containing protein n=1 Tax=Rhodoferax sp. TaxID=50421 RepID=UPI0027269D1B|nr:DUF2442 domain-containing protein [Rhodoferax sp.]MDO8318973.1 DUF2442 domain-containing protein [Rhodoferax sp.]